VDSLTSLHVHDVRTSQEPYLQASTACYGDSFTFLHVDDVRTSQEPYLRASTACYGDSLTFLHVDDIRTPQEPYLRASTACYGDTLTFLHVDDIRTSQKPYLQASTACYGYSFTFLHVYDVRTSQEPYLRVSTACYGDSLTCNATGRARIYINSPLQQKINIRIKFIRSPQTKTVRQSILDCSSSIQPKFCSKQIHSHVDKSLSTSETRKGDQRVLWKGACRGRCICRGGRIFTDLVVLRHYVFAFLAQLLLREGKELGNEQGKGAGKWTLLGPQQIGQKLDCSRAEFRY
jgi:hypothetical protein